MQAGRHEGRQVDRQVGRQVDRQVDRQAGRPQVFYSLQLAQVTDCLLYFIHCCWDVKKISRNMLPLKNIASTHLIMTTSSLTIDYRSPTKGYYLQE